MSLVPDRAWRIFGTICATIAAANLAVWVAEQAGRPAAAAAAAAAAAFAVVAAVSLRARLRRRDSGVDVLAWDGTQWLGAVNGHEACVGNARVMLDLGAWLLVRFEPVARRPAHWLVATRRMAGPAWPVWRAALHSRRRPRELGAP